MGPKEFKNVILIEVNRQANEVEGPRERWQLIRLFSAFPPTQCPLIELS